MGIFIDLLISTLTQGLIYAQLSYGVYITYKILDFPDLTVDGSFPLGAAVTAVLLVSGFNPYLALLISAGVGALAGLVTGMIHVRLKVRDLLAGIIVICFGSALYMTADLGVSTYDAVAIVLSGKWKLAPFQYCRIATIWSASLLV